MTLLYLISFTLRSKYFFRYATSNGFVVPKRTAGSSTIHNYKSVHGVTSMTGGIRYSLFLCQTIPDDEEHEEEQQHVKNEEVELGTNLKEQVLKEFDFFESAGKKF